MTTLSPSSPANLSPISIWERFAFPCLLLLGLVLVLLPFAGIESLALSDHANHMSRFHVRENLDSSAALQSLYQIQDTRYAYWGMEIFMRALTPIMGVEKAGYVFTVTAFYLPFAGALTLNRVVTGRTNVFALTAFFFVFSEIAGWGFTNFLFTLGLALFAFAAWIATDKTSWKIRLPLFIAIGVAIALLHTICAALLGASIGVWELARVVYAKRLDTSDIGKFLVLGVAFLPAAAIVLNQASVDTGSAGMRWISLGYHLSVFFAPVNFLNGRTALLWHVAPMVGLYLLVKWANARSDEPVITFDKPLLWVAAFLVLLGPLSPFSISGVAYIGTRFPVVGALVAAAAIRDMPRLMPRTVLAGLAVILLFRVGLVHSQLKRVDTEIAEMRSAASVIPKGTKVLVLMSGETNATLLDPRPMPSFRYSNLAGYLVLDRDALFPYFFSMFDVGVADAHKSSTVPQGYAARVNTLGTDDAPEYAKNWQVDFDYGLHMHFGDAPRPDVPGTTVIHDGSWFTYIKIEKP